MMAAAISTSLLATVVAAANEFVLAILVVLLAPTAADVESFCA